MQGAVDDEVLVKEQSVTLPEELEGKVQVTPTPQFTGIQVPASKVPVFRLGAANTLGLILRLEDEEIPAVVLQNLHHPFLALLRIFGMSMGLLLLNTVAEFSTVGDLQPAKSEETGYFGYVSEVHGYGAVGDEVVSAVYQVIRAIREIRSQTH